MIAGAADQIVQACAFASEDDYGIGREVEAVVILCAALVQPDTPDIAFAERLQSADDIDDAGEAKMFGCPGRGFDGHGAEGGGAAFGEEDAIDAGGFGGAEQSAEVLRVLDAVEGEKQAGRGTFEEILDVEELAFADDGDHPLVIGSAGHAGEGLARLDAGFDSFLAAESGDAGYALVVAVPEAFGGDADVVEAARAGAQGFLDGMQAEENFHLLPV